MKYEKPNMEILELEVGASVITTSPMTETQVGGNGEGGSFGDLFGY